MYHCCGASKRLIESWLDEDNFQGQAGRESTQSLVVSIARRYDAQLTSLSDNKVLIKFQQATKDASKYFEYIAERYAGRFSSMELNLPDRVVLEIK